MKTFDDLTPEQQRYAIAYAKSELEAHLSYGIVVFEGGTTKEKVEKYALAAAEGSMYDENGVAIK